MKRKIFGQLKDGRDVHCYTLKNKLGMEVNILDYGGIVQSIKVPVASGKREVVLGYEVIEDYEKNPAYLGAVIGRTAGRLKNARLRIKEKSYMIDTNHKGHLLHGGSFGFHQQRMLGFTKTLESEESLTLMFDVPSYSDGFPGNIKVTLVYNLLAEENTLLLRIKACTDEETYLNITNHSYFNLSKDASRSIADHYLLLNADNYSPIDESFLPQKQWQGVKGTVFDFQQEALIKKALSSSTEQVHLAKGIDHPFRIKADHQPKDLNFVGQLLSPDRGLKLSVYTTQPHVVIYTGNYLDEGCVPSGRRFKQHQGICFEAQEKPNLVNSDPAQCRLTFPDKPYEEEIRYVFSVMNPDESD